MVLYQRRIAYPLLVKLFAIVLIVLTLSSCNVFSNNEILPYYNSQDLTPNWNTKKEHRITAFNFVDQNGKNFGSKSLKDKIYIFIIFFIKTIKKSIIIINFFFNLTIWIPIFI